MAFGMSPIIGRAGRPDEYSVITLFSEIDPPGPLALARGVRVSPGNPPSIRLGIRTPHGLRAGLTYASSNGCAFVKSTHRR